jgi:hypothetical protein
LKTLKLPGPFLIRIALWLILQAACPYPGPIHQSFDFEVLGRTIPSAVSPAPESASLDLHDAAPAVSDRVLLYLERAELKELAKFQDDCRIAWLTCLYASQGNPQPHIDATRRVLGLHPDKVWLALVARRKAQLGKEYSRFYDASDNWIPDPEVMQWNEIFGGASSPKKPVRSMRLEAALRRDRAA